MSRLRGLTDLKVKLLELRDEAYFTRDPLTTGLGIEVTPQGRKIWGRATEVAGRQHADHAGAQGVIHR